MYRLARPNATIPRRSFTTWRLIDHFPAEPYIHVADVFSCAPWCISMSCPPGVSLCPVGCFVPACTNAPPHPGFPAGQAGGRNAPVVRRADARIVPRMPNLPKQTLDEMAARVPREVLLRAKQMGFSDVQLARLWHSDATAVRALRKRFGVDATFKTVDTCAAEFEAHTPYHYSTYEQECEVVRSPKKKIMILGGGPNRIGQA